ncbi:RloB domain-containing protein [Frateuria aurantia]|uniref:RloB domain-containing protein n=1 Tax=Frateuria aurantia TaxID=81475 RepID=UPI0012EA272C|nr:RloB domain-containing protein [Frateuria aurantia]
MNMPHPVNRRAVKETLLIVCEGDAETAFVRYVKRTYQDVLGRAVQDVNAKGKGGKHVLDFGLNRAKYNRAPDKLILLLDTDTDWDDAQRLRAQRARVNRRSVDVVEGHPCLEAWLLHILGSEVEGDTQYQKRTFKDCTGVEAHEATWMNRLLSRDVLNGARARVPQLSELMNHMGIRAA